ncbi:hypothetical protein DY000_02038545 [Brassica cretica]|uniref:Endonuclease/exonuclease/phosphatase domain-containing protein n=1 Tax=Brassica cretica TaxID=69181 RepID=A0ABQ7BK14_BRACR|nr:hypothetical protein DY000_02038545 [Brassica cretica]
MSSVCRGWHYTSNHLSDEDGRIILIWKDPVKVRILLQSRQMVTCELILPNCLPIIYTAIYASNLSDERNDLWVELLNLHTTFGLDSKPWIIGGDFNQILYSSDHSAFNHNKHSTRMFQFRDCLYQLASFLPPVPSDHSPCLIDLAFILPKAGTQPFKFLNYLTKRPSFL